MCFAYYIAVYSFAYSKFSINAILIKIGKLVCYYLSHNMLKFHEIIKTRFVVILVEAHTYYTFLIYLPRFNIVFTSLHN